MVATIELAREFEQSNGLSVEEFANLPGVDGKRYELVAGVLVETGQTGDEHGRVMDKLNRRLGDYVEANNLGRTYPPTGFVLAPRTVRVPDVGFLVRERVPLEPLRGSVPFAPDLAVEIVSPTDIWYEVRDKVTAYQRAGTALVWVIFPPDKLVFVYRLNEPLVKILDINSELDGESVVPGFKLKVGVHFE